MISKLTQAYIIGNQKNKIIIDYSLNIWSMQITNNQLGGFMAIILEC